MGACCSTEDPDVARRERREYDRPPQIVINNAFVHRETQPLGVHQSCYGEYTCPKCGRFWTSTLSWRNSYLTCRRCNTNVYPRNQREIRSGDIKRRDGKSLEHPKNLCGKCKQLGRYCGNYNKRTSEGQGRGQMLSQIYFKY